MRNHSLKYLVYLALFISLNIILTRIAGIRLAMGGVEVVRIGLGALPVILAGILFGPAAGAIVGGVGDVIGYQINPLGAYMPQFTMTASLTGFLPVFILKRFKLKLKFWPLFISLAVTLAVTSLTLVPYFLNTLFSIPYVAIMPGKILSYVITVPTYAYLVNILVRRINVTEIKIAAIKKEIIRNKA